MKGELIRFDESQGTFVISAEVYEGGGGQPPDRIVVKGDDFVIEAAETREVDGVTYWIASSVKGNPRSGTVEVFIDELWRWEVSQQHTAQHIFSALAEKHFGWPSEGFAIFNDSSKIELQGADEDTAKYELLEREVNQVIWERRPVRAYVTDQTEVTRKMVEFKNPRIVEIEGIDKCPCGGTHVPDTGYVGGFSILKVERKNTRYVRVVFAAGLRLARLAREWSLREQKLKNLLSGEVEERIGQILEQKKGLEIQKKNMLQLIQDFVAKSAQVYWEDLPLDAQALKHVAGYVAEQGRSIVLINQEGYFAIGGPDAESLFDELKKRGASGGGKGVITGKLKQNQPR
ncbi:alanyl-tRNA editing protein [Coprothermobacteraceae bacterium]|nr:alanyl-tRNA editing protein [Coprothermobacteraceae bacterium]